MNELDIDLLNQRKFLLPDTSSVELRFGSNRLSKCQSLIFDRFTDLPAHGRMIKHESCFGVFHIDSLSVQNLNFR